MLKKILSVIGFIVILIVGKGIGKIAGHAIGNAAYPPSKPTIQQIENELAKSADSINKTLPMMVDKETRLDKIKANSGLRVNYFYTLPNYSSRDIEPSLIQTNVKPDVKKNTCTNEKAKPILQLGVTYEYVYSGNDGVEIARFDINKNDCNNLANVATIGQPPASTVPAPSTPTKINNIGCIGDCVNGQGTYTYANSDTYKGKFKNGRRDGQGVYFFANGDKHEGTWKNNNRHGQGILTFANGSTKTGKWKNDQLAAPVSPRVQQRQIPKGGADNTQLQTPKALSEIRGDTNNDGILSGSEQYLRDNPTR